MDSTELELVKLCPDCGEAMQPKVHDWFSEWYCAECNSAVRKE